MNRDDLERIRSANRVETILAKYLELKPRGRCLIARCPFHQDRTPSFAVFPHTQTWWCFGCNAGGDVFAFVQRIERVTFREAVERLGGAIEIKSDKAKEKSPVHLFTPSPVHSLTQEHFTLLTAATEVYHAALFTQPKLLTYLARRGLDAEAVHRFRLGYASGQDLARYFRYRGWNPNIAADLGLIGPHGEYFRERLLIPEIRDGQVVYLVGRATTKRLRAKYIGLPGAPKPLYGFEGTRNAQTVFIVEGPFDWLTLVNWGYAARGLLGAHLKREYERELEHVQHLGLVLDNDAEGERASQTLAEIFGARTFHVPLPNGVKDVNELAQRPNGRAIFERLWQHELLQQQPQLLQQAQSLGGKSP